MTILIDACVPHRYLRLLREWGIASELSSDHLEKGAPDSDVILLAARMQATLLTVDLDFANILDYPPSDHHGIIVLRYQPDQESQMDATLKTALKDLYPDGLGKVLVVISPGRYRVRKE